MDNGYEMPEYIDEADEPLGSGADYVVDDEIDEVPAIIDDTEVNQVSVIGMLTALPKRGRGRPPKADSEKVSVFIRWLLCLVLTFRVILHLASDL